jgi:tetratricopeptide (TPR) repeat protein
MVYLRILALFYLFSISALHGRESDDPELNFDHLWNTLDRNYAQFGVKRVDWDALYNVYRWQVSPQTTPERLWEIMLAMIRHLNDAHVCLSDGHRRVSAGFIEDLAMHDFSRRLVETEYLRGKAGVAVDGKLTYGWLTDTIGYLHIADFKTPDFKRDSERWGKAMDRIIEEFGSAEGMVVDVRDNTGGHARMPRLVAGRFADCTRHYATTWYRYGEKRDDFISAHYWNVEPVGPKRFLKPTVLLTHRFTESAAEGFTLAMRVLPHVTVVGEITGGACSSQYPERLPNGWTLWVSYKKELDPDGICWDGIGIPPDLRITNTRADIEAGEDRVLDFAVTLLEEGDLEPQHEESSLANLKRSRVRKFVHDVEELGLDAAKAALHRSVGAGDDEYNLSFEELMVQAREYDQENRLDEEIVLLEICRKAFPRAAVHGSLALAYVRVGRDEAAKAVLAEDVQPMYAWEASLLERARRVVPIQVQGSALAKALAEKGTEAAEREYEKLVTQQGLDERDLNRLAYFMKLRGELEASLFVLERAVESHPRSPGSWILYDTFAEVLVAAGKRDQAMECCRKSMALNPDNHHAETLLEQLQRER